MNLPPTRLRFLGHDDIVACGLAEADITLAVREILVAKRRGGALTRRKLGFPGRAPTSFSAKGGAWLDRGYAAVKWYGFTNDNIRHGLPDFHPLIALNRADTGMPVALLDGRWISSIRTASISIVAAELLARPASASIGFVACGAQAQAHLQAFASRYPLRQVTAYSPSGVSARRLVRAAKALGLEARVTEVAREAIEGHDIVVTSMPRLARSPGLDARWLAKGAFASLVDLGYSWHRQSLSALDLVVTDDLEPETRRPSETLNYDGSFAAELSDWVGERAPRQNAAGRCALIFGGTALADVAAAITVHDRAVERGIGQQLAL